MKRARSESDETIDSIKIGIGKTVLNITKGNKTALVRYFKNFLSKEDAEQLYQELYSLKSKYFDQDLVNTPKGKVKAPRFTAAFGEKGIRYEYAGYTRKTVEEWPEHLLKCKKRIETELGVELNYGFINIYEVVDDDGELVEHYIGWHSDSEGDIKTTSDGQTTICSISLGDERKFQLREIYKPGKDKPTEIHSIVLENGSLCTMEKHTQQLMKHCVPKKKGATKPRINITFRMMITRN